MAHEQLLKDVETAFDRDGQSVFTKAEFLSHNQVLSEQLIPDDNEFIDMALAF